MISFIVARIVRRTYEQLNRQEVDAALKGFKPDARFIFSGTHALGTDIRGTDMIKRWFERAYRLVPDVHFDVHDVLVRGGPWNMRVVSYFTVTGTLAGEREYRNKGMQMLHL